MFSRLGFIIQFQRFFTAFPVLDAASKLDQNQEGGCVFFKVNMKLNITDLPGTAAALKYMEKIDQRAMKSQRD
jgi:hypothetical protein